jgi:hypothetical protein
MFSSERESGIILAEDYLENLFLHDFYYFIDDKVVTK